jgi:diguanylate cyclase (GGDEF)-like protein
MITELQFQQGSTSIQRRLLLLVLVVGFMVALLIFSSYRLGNRMVERYTPLIDAVMELQLHATISRLWFEEILSQQRNEDIHSVYRHLDIAERYSELMLQGGEYESVTYLPLQDELMIAHCNTVRGKLSQFRLMLDKRWALRKGSAPASDIEQKFNTVFNELIVETDELERHLHALIREAKHRFYLSHAVLLLFAVTVTLALGWALRRFMLRQAYGVHLLERANLELAAEVEKRKRTEALLEKQATTDHLTGILNRSRMSELLEEEWHRVERYPENFSLIMFDIDHFKQVNDQLGHQAGDKVLIEVSHRVRRELRDIDALARWGGEEFLILLPKTGIRGAEEVAERCRRAFAELPVEGIGRVTASFGVVEYSAQDESLQRLLQRVDAAVYEAKMAGRDTVRRD